MKRYVIGASILFITGCKVGPDYHIPNTPMPKEYVETKKEKTFAPTDQELVGWWNIFNDPFLNSILTDAVSGNFDYQIALEQVNQSRSEYWVEFTHILPELDFDASASRFRTSRSFASQKPSSTTTSSSTTTTSTPTPASFPPLSSPTTATSSTTSTTATTGVAISPVQSFFQVGFDVIWEIDLFGKLRRSADAAYDTYESVAEISQDVKITLLSEVAKVYTAICALQEKVALQTDIVATDEFVFSLVNDKFASGLTSEQEVESSKATLETDKASLKTLQTSLKETIYSLAVLLGKEPEKILCDFLTKRSIPLSRGKVPEGLPADLLKRRHDIRAAERQLAAATEQVGVAVAQLYPQLSLSGSSSSFAANPLQGANYGFSSDKLNKLFHRKSRIWGIGGLLTVPVFDFGNRLAGIDAQKAIQRQAALSYQKTVLVALQEVESALTAAFNEEERSLSLEKTEAAYKKNYELTLSLFEAGLADSTQVAASKEIWLSAASTLTDSHQTLTTNVITLYKSLGGNW